MFDTPNTEPHQAGSARDDSHQHRVLSNITIHSNLKAYSSRDERGPSSSSPVSTLSSEESLSPPATPHCPISNHHLESRQCPSTQHPHRSQPLTHAPSTRSMSALHQVAGMQYWIQQYPPSAAPCYDTSFADSSQHSADTVPHGNMTGIHVGQARYRQPQHHCYAVAAAVAVAAQSPPLKPWEKKGDAVLAIINQMLATLQSQIDEDSDCSFESYDSDDEEAWNQLGRLVDSRSACTW